MDLPNLLGRLTQIYFCSVQRASFVFAINLLLSTYILERRDVYKRQPHGCANAIYLPYVIKYNAKDPVAASRYAEIARRMGLEGTSQQALINSLCEKIDSFNVKLNIPKTLKEFGINEEEFKEKVAKIAELAVGDACTGSDVYKRQWKGW